MPGTEPNEIERENQQTWHCLGSEMGWDSRASRGIYLGIELLPRPDSPNNSSPMALASRLNSRC